MRTIVIPIEVHKREAYPKALLAAYLSSRGYRVVVLPDFLVPHLALEEGLYLGKNHTHYSLFKRNTIRGAKFIFLDDEGAPITGDPGDRTSQIKQRLWKGVTDFSDVILTWGEFQRECFSSLTKLPTVAVGYPGIHVCKPYFKEILKLYNSTFFEEGADYILINTRYGSINSGYPLSEVRNDNPYMEVEGISIREFRRNVQNELSGLTHSINLIESIAAEYKDQRIVVRPHPGEIQETYRYLLSDFKNVDVDNSGHVAPWLAGAKCVIMNGCTTSVQAHLMGTRILNFLPEGRKDLTSYVDNIGTSCFSVSEVLRCLSGLNSASDLCLSSTWVDVDDLYSLHVDTFERILSVLDEFYPLLPAKNRSSSSADNIKLNSKASLWFHLVKKHISSYDFYSDKLGTLVDSMPSLMSLSIKTRKFAWGFISEPK